MTMGGYRSWAGAGIRSVAGKAASMLQMLTRFEIFDQVVKSDGWVPFIDAVTHSAGGKFPNLLINISEYDREAQKETKS
jgi:hypothetical protein